MSTVQRIALAIVPDSWGKSMREESERWHIRCDTCGFSRSIWALGGIRWKAYSRGKKTLVRCPQCAGIKVASVVKLPEAPHA